jgi:hypothetical protein
MFRNFYQNIIWCLKFKVLNQPSPFAAIFGSFGGVAFGVPGSGPLRSLPCRAGEEK